MPWSSTIKEESSIALKSDKIEITGGKKMTYSKEFREEAIILSDEIGIKKAASQLGIPYYTLADWRYRRNGGRRKPTTQEPMSETSE